MGITKNTDMIDITKKYKFRNGEPARVICKDAPGSLPVASLDDKGNIYRHRLDGSCFRGSESSYDLIEVREPLRVWVNIHQNGNQFTYPTEEIAKRVAADNATRIAVPFVEVVEP